MRAQEKCTWIAIVPEKVTKLLVSAAAPSSAIELQNLIIQSRNGHFQIPKFVASKIRNHLQNCPITYLAYTIQLERLAAKGHRCFRFFFDCRNRCQSQSIYSSDEVGNGPNTVWSRWAGTGHPRIASQSRNCERIPWWRWFRSGRYWIPCRYLSIEFLLT